MKKILLGALLLTLTTVVGCGGGFRNDVTKTVAAFTYNSWRVTVWSGGQAVKVYEIRNGYISSEQGSDGWFFTYNGKLVRVSGTVTVEEM